MKHLNTKPKYIYILVRRDVALPYQIVQAAHAAIDSTRNHINADEEHPHLVLLEVKNSNQLKKVIDYAETNGIRMHNFYDSDLDTIIATASEPIIEEEQRKVFKKYQLFKDRNAITVKGRVVKVQPLEIV